MITNTHCFVLFASLPFKNITDSRLSKTPVRRDSLALSQKKKKEETKFGGPRGRKKGKWMEKEQGDPSLSIGQIKQKKTEQKKWGRNEERGTNKERNNNNSNNRTADGLA